MCAQWLYWFGVSRALKICLLLLVIVLFFVVVLLLWLLFEPFVNSTWERNKTKKVRLFFCRVSSLLLNDRISLLFKTTGLYGWAVCVRARVRVVYFLLCLFTDYWTAGKYLWICIIVIRFMNLCARCFSRASLMCFVTFVSPCSSNYSIFPFARIVRYTYYSLRMLCVRAHSTTVS